MSCSFKRVALALALVVAMGSAQASARGGHGHGHHGHHYGYLALPLVALFAWAAHSSSHHAAPYPRRHYGYTRPCHFVIKDTYNQDADRVRLGGTMCYDSYGNGYIAPGSKHFIGFLD